MRNKSSMMTPISETRSIVIEDKKFLELVWLTNSLIKRYLWLNTQKKKLILGTIALNGCVRPLMNMGVKHIALVLTILIRIVDSR